MGELNVDATYEKRKKTRNAPTMIRAKTSHRTQLFQALFEQSP